ncbi:MAG: hypothetical protein ACR652_15965 [Methylocystis sp.]|uniref:hypothetical protein n=1 Tax=Methylocystis sp. TaxID=1911079 RepID=UPI003DA51750
MTDRLVMGNRALSIRPQTSDIVINNTGRGDVAPVKVEKLRKPEQKLVRSMSQGSTPTQEPRDQRERKLHDSARSGERPGEKSQSLTARFASDVHRNDERQTEKGAETRSARSRSHGSTATREPLDTSRPKHKTRQRDHHDTIKEKKSIGNPETGLVRSKSEGSQTQASPVEGRRKLRTSRNRANDGVEKAPTGGKKLFRLPWRGNRALDKSQQDRFRRLAALDEDVPANPNLSSEESAAWPAFEREGFDKREMLRLQTAGLGIEEGKLYRAKDLRITEDTVASQPKDVKVELLKKGKCGQVYKTQYKTEDGSTYAGAFKPLALETKSNGAIASGINPRNPQLAMRNVIVDKLARKLGFTVVDPIKVAIRTLPDGSVELGLETRMITEGVQGDDVAGMTGRYGQSNIYENPQIWPSLIELQLLDALTGQIDRHAGNWFVCEVDKIKKVVGFDHDFCLGDQIKTPNDASQSGALSNDILKTGVRTPVFHGVLMPPVIDTDMAEAIEKLSPDELRKIIGRKLTESERDAAGTRLTALKAHVTALRKGGRVVDPKEWGKPVVKSWLLGDGQRVDDSYILREFKYWDEYLHMSHPESSESSTLNFNTPIKPPQPANRDDSETSSLNFNTPSKPPQPDNRDESETSGLNFSLPGNPSTSPSHDPDNAESTISPARPGAKVDNSFSDPFSGSLFDSPVQDNRDVDRKSESSE